MKITLFIIMGLVGMVYGKLEAPIHPLLVRVQERLEQVQTLTARFEQVDPVNKTLKGTFYLARPGRLKFQYDPPAPFLIVANGSALIYEDATTQQATFFPLNVGPAALLLSPHISFKDVGTIESVEETSEYIVVRLFSSHIGRLIFFFDRVTGMIRGWTTVDAQGNEIRVSFSQIQENKPLSNHLFQFQQKPRWIVKRNIQKSIHK